MSTAPPLIRDFARQLVAIETARPESPAAGGREAVRVGEKLHLPVARLAGEAGFRSLMSRALALAKAEVPSLAAVQVRADGSLAGLDGHANDQETGVEVVAQLLGLLVTFIGEPLTLRLVRDAWPDASVSGMGAGSAEGP